MVLTLHKDIFTSFTRYFSHLHNDNVALVVQKNIFLTHTRISFLISTWAFVSHIHRAHPLNRCPQDQDNILLTRNIQKTVLSYISYYYYCYN